MKYIFLVFVAALFGARFSSYLSQTSGALAQGGHVTDVNKEQLVMNKQQREDPFIVCKGMPTLQVALDINTNG